MFAKVNGYKIFFDVEGVHYVPDGPVMREKPVCLVLHGGPGFDHAHLMPALSPLSEIMQLIYIDDRNCGRSDRIDWKTNSIKQNVDDIEALREYLGLEKIFIFGHSYGGMKAQRYIIDYPEHVQGAILACTVANADGLAQERVVQHVKEWGTPEQYEIWRTNALAKGLISADEYMKKMAPLYHGKDRFNEREALESNMRFRKTDEVTQYQFSGELADMDQFNLLPELPGVDLPCLILSGGKDFITDMEANLEIHKAIPNSEFHVIHEDASHEIFADYPEIVFPIIEDFVKRNFKPDV